MRIIDETEREMPDINPRKVCFIIEKSREMSSGDEVEGPDASDLTEDDSFNVMSGAGQAALRSELSQFLAGLDDDETAALVALVWIGRGDFDADEWRNAVAEARGRRERSTAQYLLGTPLLPDYLEDALAAFGRSCGDSPL
jgi:hypothetical protein